MAAHGSKLIIRKHGISIFLIPCTVALLIGTCILGCSNSEFNRKTYATIVNIQPSFIQVKSDSLVSHTVIDGYTLTYYYEVDRKDYRDTVYIKRTTENKKYLGKVEKNLRKNIFPLEYKSSNCAVSKLVIK